MNSSADKRHRLLLVVVAIVLPAETDLTVLDVEQAIVGDGDAVGIAADVVEHLLGSGERALGIDHPFGSFVQAPDNGQKACALAAGSPGARRRTAACRRRRPSEDTSGTSGGTGGTGPGPAGRSPAGRRSSGCRRARVRRRARHNADADDAAVLSPGVEHGEEADLGAQVLGIGGDGAQGLGRGPEQNAVDHLLVLVSDGGDLFRHGEHDVEVLGVEKFGLAVLDPLGAGQGLALWDSGDRGSELIADALVAALIALFEVAAERGRAAHLDRGHDAPLRGGHRRAMLLAIGFAVAAEDIRHFQLRALHRPGAQKY